MPEVTTTEQITVPKEYLKELEESYYDLVRTKGTKVSDVIEDECLTRTLLHLRELKSKHGVSHRLSPYIC